MKEGLSRPDSSKTSFFSLIPVILALGVTVKLPKSARIERAFFLDDSAINPNASLNLENDELKVPRGASAYVFVDGIKMLIRDFLSYGAQPIPSRARIGYGGKLVRTKDKSNHRMKGGETILLYEHNEEVKLKDADITVVYDETY